MKIEYFVNIFEIQITNFMKIRPLGAELFHADGQVDSEMDRGTERHDDERFS